MLAPGCGVRADAVLPSDSCGTPPKTRYRHAGLHSRPPAPPDCAPELHLQLAPCALRAAHVHMRASGLLYVVDANALAVAVVLPDGPAVVNTITTGASTVFPQGACAHGSGINALRGPAMSTLTVASDRLAVCSTYETSALLAPDP